MIKEAYTDGAKRALEIYGLKTASGFLGNMANVGMQSLRGIAGAGRAGLGAVGQGVSGLLNKTPGAMGQVGSGLGMLAGPAALVGGGAMLHKMMSRPKQPQHQMMPQMPGVY